MIDTKLMILRRGKLWMSKWIQWSLVLPACNYVVGCGVVHSLYYRSINNSSYQPKSS